MSCKSFDDATGIAAVAIAIEVRTLMSLNFYAQAIKFPDTYHLTPALST
jgi:hypothetical protein